MTAKVFRLQNSEALDLPEIEELFRKAFPGDEHFAPYDDARDEFKFAIQRNPNIAIHVGVEDGEPRGLSVTTLPGGKLVLRPSVVHFYVGRADRGGASAELRKAMQDAIVNYIGSHGYTKFEAVCPHTSPKRVAAWRRLFRRGGKAEQVGSIERFTIGA
jgi:hypothetical protein